MGTTSGNPSKADLDHSGMNGTVPNGRSKKSSDQKDDLVQNYLNSLEDPFTMHDELDRPRYDDD